MGIRLETSPALLVGLQCLEGGEMHVRLFSILALVPLATLALVLPATAQDDNQNKPAVIRVPDGGANGPMESIFIPPKPGAPFSLKLAAEWTRPMNGGGTFTLVNERRIVRDARGRIYQERWILVPKGGALKSIMNVFQITDPEAHTWYNCKVFTKVCEILPYRLTTEDKYVPPVGTTGPLPGGRGTRVVEDLGMSTVQGVETHGYRDTATVNPGVLGNSQPMVNLHEFWYSPELGINLLSTVDTPESGHQVFTVKELTQGEPEPALFLVPDDYKVVDHREEQQQN
jgi:hypothetical protein